MVADTSPELDTYDADTCSKNGGWGKIGIQGDGCYSNPVPVDVPVSITSTEFYVVIHFINNDRNMHLNVQHMNMNYATCVKSSIIQYNPCKPGVSDRWFPIPTRLRHDFSVVRGHGSPSLTARDIRSGNPHQESWVRLPNVAASNPPNKLRFNYEYVVGCEFTFHPLHTAVHAPSLRLRCITAGGQRLPCRHQSCTTVTDPLICYCSVMQTVDMDATYHLESKGHTSPSALSMLRHRRRPKSTKARSWTRDSPYSDATITLCLSQICAIVELHLR